MIIKLERDDIELLYELLTEAKASFGNYEPDEHIEMLQKYDKAINIVKILDVASNG